VSGSEHGPMVFHDTSLVTDPTSTISPEEQLIEDLVYEHLYDLVDFDRMNELEQIVTQKLLDLPHLKGGADDDDLEVSTAACVAGADRAAALIERAWHRLIKDERRYVDWGGAWEPDDDCPLCRAIADADGAKPDDHAGHGGGRAPERPS
jgi:hypothetical protein